MKVSQSDIASQVKQSYKSDICDLYFFNDIVISEFNEGVHVTFENSKDVLKHIIDYFGTNKPFGFISNMINSYSIAPMDSAIFKEEMKNLSAYGVVSYTQAGRLNAEIENNFCDNENICFNDLYDAANSVYGKVKHLTI